MGASLVAFSFFRELNRIWFQQSLTALARYLFVPTVPVKVAAVVVAESGSVLDIMVGTCGTL
jgi:hypothetical protein